MSRSNDVDVVDMATYIRRSRTSVQREGLPRSLPPLPPPSMRLLQSMPPRFETRLITLLS